MPAESLPSAPSKQPRSMHNTEQFCENLNQLKTSANVWTLSEDNKLCSLLNGVEESLVGRIDETLKRLEESNAAITRSVVNMTNADNRLTSFANDQFIENRVYDDPPPPPRCSSASNVKENVKQPIQKSSKRQEETVENMREAVALGFEMIKSHFKRIEMRPEDFDEDDDPTFIPDPIFEPYDSHLSRALPHLVGTLEWNTSPSIGICDSFAVDDHLTKKIKGEEIVIGLPQFVQPHHITSAKTADVHRTRLSQNAHRTTTNKSRQYDVEEEEEENDGDDGELQKQQQQQERKPATTMLANVTDSHRSDHNGLFSSDNDTDDNDSSSDNALFNDDLFSSSAYKKGTVVAGSSRTAASARVNNGKEGGISGRGVAEASLISELSRKQQQQIEHDPSASKISKTTEASIAPRAVPPPPPPPPPAALPISVRKQNQKSQNQVSVPSSSSSSTDQTSHYHHQQQPKSHQNSAIFAPGFNDSDAENDEEQPTMFSEKSMKPSKPTIGASNQLKSNTSSVTSIRSLPTAAASASSSVTNLFGKNVTSLFGDSDSDDDIFADVKVRVVKKIDDEPRLKQCQSQPQPQPYLSTASLHPVSTTYNDPDDRHLQNSDSLQKQQLRQPQSSSTASTTDRHLNNLSSPNSSSYPSMKKSVTTASGAITTTTLTSNLFDDDSDEDDLFKSSTMSSSEKPIFRNRPGGISSNFADRLSQLITTPPKSVAATNSLTNDVRVDDNSVVSTHQKASSVNSANFVSSNDSINTTLPSLVKSRTKGPSRRSRPTRQARTKTSIEEKDVTENASQITTDIGSDDHYMERKTRGDLLNQRLENDDISSDKSSLIKVSSLLATTVDSNSETDSNKNLPSTKESDEDDNMGNDKSDIVAATDVDRAKEVTTDKELIREGGSLSQTTITTTTTTTKNSDITSTSSSANQQLSSVIKTTRPVAASVKLDSQPATKHSNEQLNHQNRSGSKKQQQTSSSCAAGRGRGKRAVGRGGLFVSDSNSSDSDDDIFAFSSKLKAHDQKTKTDNDDENFNVSSKATANDSFGSVVSDNVIGKRSSLSSSLSPSSSVKMQTRISDGSERTITTSTTVSSGNNTSVTSMKPAKSKSIFDDSDEDTAEDENDIASSPIRTSTYQNNNSTTANNVTQQQSGTVSTKIQQQQKCTSISTTPKPITTAKQSSSQKTAHGGGIFDSDSDDLFK